MDTEAAPDNYCAAPFRHMVLESNGRMSPCCLWNHGKIPDHAKPSALAKDPFNQAWMQQVRSDMLANTEIAGCSECNMREASGVKSMRSAFNLDYGKPTESQLRYIEFNLGNLCNLKCRMCGSWSSSKWAADEIALGLRPDELVRPQIHMLAPYLDSIDKLRFIGGEPSLEQESIIIILEQIKSVKGSLTHMRVDLTSNCMVRLEQQLIDLLGQCKRVELQCSVDGFGKANDYQRTGADWATLTNNLAWYQQHLPLIIEPMILTSWSLLNVNSAIDFLAFVKQHLPRLYVWGHLVREPAHLDICNVPALMKSTLISRLESWTEYDNLHWVQHNKQVIISQLMASAHMMSSDVLHHIARLDQLRNEDFAVIDPEMYAALIAACENTNQA